MTTLAFFNNKGGVGKTSIVYHLAWMYADLGVSVIAADLDPQTNLTGMFLDDERMEALWQDEKAPNTIYRAVQPLLEGTGDIKSPRIERITDGLGLLPGDLTLSMLEDELSSQWTDCLDRKPRAFRVLSAFWRSLQFAAQQMDASLVLIDVGPNLGAINRAALISANRVAIPLAPDLYSLQGLRNLGPTLRRWQEEWSERYERNPISDLTIPKGEMHPVGYIVMQHAVRLDRPVQAYERWMKRIPNVYREAVMQDKKGTKVSVQKDPYCLALLKHYRSLMPLAQEARKPMFHLKPADGAIGGHIAAVQSCYQDFRELAIRIAERCGLNMPDFSTN
jgi:chromosome partitioning protein